jgi:hypothetical protein
MKASNILLKSFFEIQNTNVRLKGIEVKKTLVGTKDAYLDMQQLSIKSFKKNLAQPWELIQLNGTQPTIQEAFLYVMLETHRTWNNYYPCNILYTDPDTLCIKPLDIFGKFQEFRLFADSPILVKEHLNCGVRYFPYNLNDCFWNDMYEQIEKWDYSVWDTEQTIYQNLMFNQEFDQTQSQDYVVNNEWVLGDRTGELPQQSILHLHSSKNPAQRLTIMKDLCERI